MAAVLSLIVAVAAWQWPRSPATPPTPPATGGSATGTAGGPGRTPATATAPATRDSRYLADLAPESGADLIAPLPRPISEDPTWAAHPLVVRCPSNQTGDERHDVVYQLRGRYVEAAAEVRTYHPPKGDAEAAVVVTMVTSTRERDGTLTTADVTASGQGPLAAAIDGAEKLTVRVRCEDPGDLVVLTEARIS
ncbi:hypothetical protein [Actinoplanes sp. NBRC 103695]|uniref:hypothetical protein n=1 Tax=Actinoplanes sp. NBRC 103695 TaxID=3032202 RepID=UPI002553F8C0|nr:hypothetical protein [Actinoplanes sp. NBRC 103695]